MKKISKFSGDTYSVEIDYSLGVINSYIFDGKEILSKDRISLFEIGFRNDKGEELKLGPADAGKVELLENGAIYSDFQVGIKVITTVKSHPNRLLWNISVENVEENLLVEWVDYPRASFKPLLKNGGVAKVLFPYNEGVLVDDVQLREQTHLKHTNPQYPSKGEYTVFPNMVCSQFLGWVANGYGFCFLAEDLNRGVKAIDFYPTENGVAFQMKIYCGVGFGESFNCDYPLVWEGFSGNWYDAANIYRNWFENNLPKGCVKVCENKELPSWYNNFPLVITYPIRGYCDSVKMEPNEFFPYQNALGKIDEIAKETGCQPLVLLMHWEGTAPWAPPYVWPPYGGVEIFNEFADELHSRGALLGVYCSGFGWTEKSNIVDGYSSTSSKFGAVPIEAFCAGPDNIVTIGTICTTQRVGYDICVGSSVGREILDEAYLPLLTSKVDYIQLLDQNHGGGQYFCYSRNHGHAPAPGPWMTEEMQSFLSVYNEKAGKKLFGCESAAAEPFLGNLLFNDNRFEVNYLFGEPVPLYAFLYHEYIHNFMGNQIGSLFRLDGVCMRFAYSFVAGDALTVVLNPKGFIQPNWCYYDLTQIPDQKAILTLIKNLRSCYNQIGSYLSFGKMIKPLKYECDKEKLRYGDGHFVCDKIFSSAWEYQGNKMQLFVNHTSKAVEVRMEDRIFEVQALSAVFLTW